MLTEAEAALIVLKLAEAWMLNGRTERAIPYYERAIDEAADRDVERRTQLVRGLTCAYLVGEKSWLAIETIERFARSIGGADRVPRSLMVLAAVAEHNVSPTHPGHWFGRVEAIIEELTVAAA